jgi:hypothetical protein
MTILYRKATELHFTYVGSWAYFCLRKSVLIEAGEVPTIHKPVAVAFLNMI